MRRIMTGGAALSAAVLAMLFAGSAVGLSAGLSA